MIHPKKLRNLQKKGPKFPCGPKLGAFTVSTDRWIEIKENYEMKIVEFRGEHCAINRCWVPFSAYPNKHRRKARHIGPRSAIKAMAVRVPLKNSNSKSGCQVNPELKTSNGFLTFINRWVCTFFELLIPALTAVSLLGGNWSTIRTSTVYGITRVCWEANSNFNVN